MSEETNEIKETNELKEGKEKINWGKEIMSYVIIIALAYAMAFFITRCVIIKTEIISGSMISTLNVDDRVIGNRLAYLFDEPERGDIVFFAFPDNESKTYVKRVIGLPGETVMIIDGEVYINDSKTPLPEPYLDEDMLGSYGPYTVPEGCYFMLGDNRNNSADSRAWDNKYVAKNKIYGKAWFRYRPTIDKIESASYD